MDPISILVITSILFFVVVLPAILFSPPSPKPPAPDSIIELLKKAKIVCPMCGQNPQSYSRFSQYSLTVNCPYLHSWTVKDTEWIPKTH